MDNVNNLNGVPNFGHGFQSEDTNDMTSLEVTETNPEETSNEEVETVEEITSEETE